MSALKKLALILLLSFTGCLNQAYIAADRATLEAIGPEYKAYVLADTTIDEGEKALRLDTLRSWEHRTRSAEDQ